MSLINEVLRDLDARHAGAERRGLPNEVRPLPAAGKGWSGRLVVGGFAVVALVIVGAWAAWLQTIKPAPAVAVPVPPPAIELPAPPLVIAPPAAPEPPAASEPAPPVAAAPQSLRMSAALSQPAAAKPSTAPPATASPTASAASVTPSIDKQLRNGGHERADAAYRKAAIERQQGRDAEAMALLREALQQEPAHANARQLLLSLLVERKQWPEAEAALKEGLELAPMHAPWAAALARIQVERGDASLAWATLQRYMPAGENSADYLGFAGVLLQRLQRPAEAIAYYEAALRLKPEARWWLGLGVALETSGHAGEAQKAFQSAQTANGLTPEMAALVARRLGTGKP